MTILGENGKTTTVVKVFCRTIKTYSLFQTILDFHHFAGLKTLLGLIRCSTWGAHNKTSHVGRDLVADNDIFMDGYNVTDISVLINNDLSNKSPEYLNVYSTIECMVLAPLDIHKRRVVIVKS